MKKLFMFHCDCCYGALYGLFKATQEEVNNIIGKYVYFGEVLGKHSEVDGKISEDDISLFSDDPAIVEKVPEFGYNPIAERQENINDGIITEDEKENA